MFRDCSHQRALAHIVLVALIALACPLAACADEGVEIEANLAPSLWVGLSVPETPTQRGFTGSLPVEVGGYHAEKEDDVPAYVKDALKTGFTWDFSSGRGELYKKGSPFPCRVFQVALPEVQKRVLSMIVKGSAAATMRDTTPGSLSKTLAGPLAVAVVGLKSSTLSSIFPVPLALAPPSINEHVSLLALAVAGKPADAASAWKIDGAALALLSALGRQAVITTGDPAVKTALGGLVPYNTQDADFAVPYASATFGKQPFSAGVGGAVQGIVKPKPDELLKPTLWLGKLPGTVPAIDLSGAVAIAPGTSAIAVALNPCAGEHGISRVDGYALPRVASGTPYIQVFVSPYAATSFFAAKAAVMRHVLRAWRWTKILAPAGYQDGNADRALTQTLLRLNEPIWEYIVGLTVETALGPGPNPVVPQAKLDPIEARVLDARIGDMAARASNPFAAAAVYSNEPEHVSTAPAAAPTRNMFGGWNDAYHPRSGLLPDHRMDAALFTALKTDDKLKVARQLVQLVSHGFTRPTSHDVFEHAPDELIPDEWKKPVEKVALEPDLVWLGRAVQAPGAGDHPLARPFGAVGDTRAGKVLAALSAKAAAITFSGARDDDKLHFYLITSEADLRRLTSVLRYALGPLARGASLWDAQVKTAGAAVQPPYGDPWWATFKADPPSFASLPLACDQPTASITPTAASTAPVRCQDWATLSRTYLRQKTIIDAATTSVTVTGAGYPYLLAWRRTPLESSLKTDGTVEVDHTVAAALSSIANDPDDTLKAGAALSAACVPAFDANATLISTFRGESVARGAAIKALVAARLKGTPLKLTSMDYVSLKLVSELFVPASKIEERIWEWALIGADPRGSDLTAKDPPVDAIVAKLQSLLRIVAAARKQGVAFPSP